MYMPLTSCSETLGLKEALQGKAHQVGDKTRALTGPLSAEEVPEVATFKPDRGRLEELVGSCSEPGSDVSLVRFL